MLRNGMDEGSGMVVKGALLHALSWLLYQLDPDPWATRAARLRQSSGGLDHDRR